MDKILQWIPGVQCYIDDVLIIANNMEEDQAPMEQVLRRLQDFGVKIKLSKCQFFQPTVTYLGYVIGADGLRPKKELLPAIAEAPIS